MFTRRAYRPVLPVSVSPAYKSLGDWLARRAGGEETRKRREG
jgi:hypothetical protein